MGSDEHSETHLTTALDMSVGVPLDYARDAVVVSRADAEQTRQKTRTR
jgi:hypothetical protein